MKNFFHLYQQTASRLGRDFQQEEVMFLQWMYERYTMENDMLKNQSSIHKVNS